jgi:hypothetical protein
LILTDSPDYAHLPWDFKLDFTAHSHAAHLGTAAGARLSPAAAAATTQ